MSGLLPGDTASVHVESEAAVYGGLQGVDAEENEMSFDGVEMKPMGLEINSGDGPNH